MTQLPFLAEIVTSFPARRSGRRSKTLVIRDLSRHRMDGYILARFPEWEQFAKVSSCSDGADDVVEFDVPCPSLATESGLRVFTENKELTVAFHTHHRHFTDYEDPTDRYQIDAGLEYAASILEERIGVLSYYSGGKFSGSRSVDLAPPKALPKLYEGMGLIGKLEGFFRDWERVTLRSWTGRFDRDEVRD